MCTSSSGEEPNMSAPEFVILLLKKVHLSSILGDGIYQLKGLQI